jgi:hypothetical protein
MVEQVDPRLLKLVMERDQEREQRIHFQRAAHALKVQNEKLRRQMRQLTLDHAATTNRLARTEARKL